MVNCKRERERKKGGKIKGESTHTLKNDSHDFYCFKKRWMVLLMRSVSHEILRITISIPRYVHICTRQALGTEMTVNVFEREKGYWIESLSLYISNCTDQEKKKKKKKNRMDG